MSDIDPWLGTTIVETRYGFRVKDADGVLVTGMTGAEEEVIASHAAALLARGCTIETWTETTSTTYSGWFPELTA